MANEAPAVAAAAPAAAAPAAPAPAAASAAAPAAAAPAAASPVVVAADPAAVTAAEAALAQATTAAVGKAADSPEAKAAATAKAALEALKPAPAAAAKKAPESYEDFKAPQGVSLDKEVLTTVKAVAKELDLSQADAQKLVEKVGPVLAKSEQTRFTTLVTQRADAWRAASLADPEIGGEKHAENLAIAMKTFDAFGTPALKEVLNKTGLGDNPEVLRWAFRIGKAIGPDNKFVAGTTLTAAGVSPEDKLWPTKTT